STAAVIGGWRRGRWSAAVHRDAHGGDIGIALAVVGLEGEIVAAEIIGGRRIGVGAGRGIKRDRAVARRDNDAVAERIAVGIAGLESALGGDVFVGGQRTVARHRWLVRHVDDHRGVIGIGVAIIDLEAEIVGARIARIGR